MKILTAKYESGTIDSNSVIRISYSGQESDSIMTVPVNEENTDYQKILEWVADGNTIEDAE